MGLAPGRGKGVALSMVSQGIGVLLNRSDFLKEECLVFILILKSHKGDISATSSQMAHKNNTHTQTMQKQIWDVSD